MHSSKFRPNSVSGRISSRCSKNRRGKSSRNRTLTIFPKTCFSSAAFWFMNTMCAVKSRKHSLMFAMRLNFATQARNCSQATTFLSSWTFSKNRSKSSKSRACMWFCTTIARSRRRILKCQKRAGSLWQCATGSESSSKMRAFALKRGISSPTSFCRFRRTIRSLWSRCTSRIL